MSSTPVNPARPVQPAATAQPQQTHVDAVAENLNHAANAMQTPQQRNDAVQARNTEQAAATRQSDEERKQDNLQAAVRAQRAINQARMAQLQVGDHAVIELDKITPEQTTVGLKHQVRFLHQANAHLASGRVSNIENGPTGRILHVETAHATYQVPEQLATRADLYDDGE